MKSFQPLKRGSIWEPLLVLTGFGLVLGLSVWLISVIPSQQQQKDREQCDVQFAKGVETHWQKVRVVDLNKLRACIEQEIRPAVCEDRKSLKELLAIQTMLGVEARNDNALPLIYRPSPDRLVDFEGNFSCADHDRLVFSSLWLNLPDRAAIEKSVRALGACSADDLAQSYSADHRRFENQNSVLTRKALSMTTEWQEGAGQKMAKSFALRELINLPIVSNVPWQNQWEEKLLTTSCLPIAKVSPEALSAAKTGPKEAKSILARNLPK